MLGIIIKGNIEKTIDERVKSVLHEGANVNQRIGQDKETFLHLSSDIKLIKKLLLRGAYVDARNVYNETPLHTAITKRKQLALVGELLKHGADVDAKTRNGYTPLNHAVKQNCMNLEVIKLLLEYGANINETSSARENHITPLGYAVRDLPCAKLLIKYALIKNVDKDYRKIVNLNPYTEHKNYSVLSRFLNYCVREILQMKTDMVIDNFSLYEFVIIKCVNIKTLHAGNKITDQVILTNYPIYHDIISAKVKLCLERANLLNKLNEIQIYTGSDISNQDVKEKEVILNFDCTYIIAKYLSNEDLLNLVTAFNKHADQSLDFAVNLVDSNQTKLDEVSANSCAKRARLESSH